jgi:glycine/D-amino acid oxidase-like deaminating enzyme
VFNLGAYARLLMDDFMRDGGEIEQRDFTNPRQFAALKERTIVNATGYGARALLGDESIVPVRGQTARLIPQPEVDYGINYRGHNLSVVPRRDGILVQAQADGDFGNPDAIPDRAASEAAVGRLAALFRV